MLRHRDHDHLPHEAEGCRVGKTPDVVAHVRHFGREVELAVSAGWETRSDLWSMMHLLKQLRRHSHRRLRAVEGLCLFLVHGECGSSEQ